jgi:TBC domain-containing protein kinase-like protein
VCQKEVPLAIRENDFAYQTERLILFKSLIQGCPYSRQQLMHCSSVDVSPQQRAFIWSAILCVSGSLMQEYESLVGQESLSQTESRQISVDIPRCHQYKELLASDSGHGKLERVLKAWLAKNGQERGYVYWQGLDSLSAPFLLLNFGEESRAFACLHRLTQQFLPGFFARDNSLLMQDLLSLFSRLMAFHMPDLWQHLEREIGFTPELYAIPWFLTLFTHVLPLDRTIQVWDSLLLHAFSEKEKQESSLSFVLFLGLAILHQLRPQLLHLSFNDCILMFSDLPDLSIDRLVADAVSFSQSTPVSCTATCTVRAYPSLSCPVVEMQELREDWMSHPDKHITLIDNRSQEMREEFGLMPGSLVVSQGSASGVKDLVISQFGDSYDLLVVVNDSLMANQLVMENMPRVCYMECNSFVDQ